MASIRTQTAAVRKIIVVEWPAALEIVAVHEFLQEQVFGGQVVLIDVNVLIAKTQKFQHQSCPIFQCLRDGQLLIITSAVGWVSI